MVFLVLLRVEEYLILRYFDYGSYRGQDMMFILMPATVCWFIVICSINFNPVEGIRKKIFRELATLIFGFHLFANFYYGILVTKVFHVQTSFHSLVRFLFVISLSLGISAIVLVLSQRKPFKWLKFLY